MSDKGISIKNRNYELYVSSKPKKDKTDEQYNKYKKSLEEQILKKNKELSRELDKFRPFSCSYNMIREIKRLNNIINELEKYINEKYIYDDIGMKIFDASTLQDKLQELKGSESNE